MRYQWYVTHETVINGPVEEFDAPAQMEYRLGYVASAYARDSPLKRPRRGALRISRSDHTTPGADHVCCARFVLGRAGGRYATILGPQYSPSDVELETSSASIRVRASIRSFNFDTAVNAKDTLNSLDVSSLDAALTPSTGLTLASASSATFFALQFGAPSTPPLPRPPPAVTSSPSMTPGSADNTSADSGNGTAASSSTSDLAGGMAPSVSEGQTASGASAPGSSNATPMWTVALAIVVGVLFIAVIGCCLRERLCAPKRDRAEGDAIKGAAQLPDEDQDESTTTLAQMDVEAPVQAQEAAGGGIGGGLTGDVRITRQYAGDVPMDVTPPTKGASSTSGATAASTTTSAGSSAPSGKTSSALELLGAALADSSAEGLTTADADAERKRLKTRLKVYEEEYMAAHDGNPPRTHEEWGDAWLDYKRYAVLRRKAADESIPKPPTSASASSTARAPPAPTEPEDSPSGGEAPGAPDEVVHFV